MDTGERNSRLLIIVGGVGLSGFLFNFLGKLIGTSYSSIKISSDIIISTSQLFTSLLLAIFIVILGLAIVYCYNELFAYTLETPEKRKHLERADKFYIYLLKYIPASIIIVLLIIFLYTLYIDFVQVIKILFSISILLSAFTFLFMVVFKKVRNAVKKNLVILFNFFKILIKGEVVYFTCASLAIWAFSMMFTAIMGIEIHKNAHLKLIFNEDDNLISFEYKDNLPDYFPKEFTVWVDEDEAEEDDEEKTKTISHFEFKKSSVEVVSETNDILNEKKFNNTRDRLISKSYYYFTHEFDYKDMINVDKGTLYIYFETDVLTAKRSYLIKNEFQKNGDHVEFNLPEIKLDF